MTITDVLRNKQVRAITGWITLGIGVFSLYLLGNTFLVPLWWPSMYYWAYILWPIVELGILVVSAFAASAWLTTHQFAALEQEPVFQHPILNTQYQQEPEPQVPTTDPGLVVAGQVVAITEEPVSLR